MRYRPHHILNILTRQRTLERKTRVIVLVVLLALLNVLVIYSILSFQRARLRALAGATLGGARMIDSARGLSDLNRRPIRQAGVFFDRTNGIYGISVEV